MLINLGVIYLAHHPPQPAVLQRLPRSDIIMSLLPSSSPPNVCFINYASNALLYNVTIFPNTDNDHVGEMQSRHTIPVR